MVYGFIICAGNQTRFSSNVPKALVEYEGKHLLDINIHNMSKYCDEVYIVCSVGNYFHFNNYKGILAIESGRGCGDAVLTTLEQFNFNDDDTCFIQWGDSLQQPEIYSSLKSNWKGTTLIPCVLEEKPYVQVTKNNQNVSVNFSKFGETITKGYHDLSVFYANAVELRNKLKEFKSKIEDENGNYVHKHNNEMEFLDVFNETDIKADILDMGSYKDFSFNTVEQFNKLKGESENV